ncbi:hypothetical protein BKH42_02785 [Helicobacter sp. 13S00482-2]|nr:hypothetical protein BKH42_02785 [Helicobacter sp. 13S00482-2]
MNSKTYSLTINANFTDIDKIICALPYIFGQDKEILDDISLVLFEILSNIIEHSICRYSKDDIFSHSLKNTDQKIYLYFSSQHHPIILINYPKTIYSQKNISIGKGKKIIKYLAQSYCHKILEEEVWEKVIFQRIKNENHHK